MAGPVGSRVGTDGNAQSDQAEGNLISANAGEGVVIASAHRNSVAGNLIGTDVTGTVPLGNGFTGVLIVDGAQSNRIGTDGNGMADDYERNTLRNLLGSDLKRYQADVKAARQLIDTGQALGAEDLDPAELAAWTAVTRAVLNMSETITRN